MRYANCDVARFFVETRGRAEIESYSRHFHFKDGILYSYSTPIAIWSWKLKQIYSDLLDNTPELVDLPDNTIFLTENRYSQTTATHEGYLRYSGNGQVCEIPAEIELLMRSPSEFLNYIKEREKWCKTKLARARKPYTREHWQNQLNTCTQLIKLFMPIALTETLKLPSARRF